MHLWPVEASLESMFLLEISQLSVSAGDPGCKVFKHRNVKLKSQTQIKSRGIKLTSLDVYLSFLLVALLLCFPLFTFFHLKLRLGFFTLCRNTNRYVKIQITFSEIQKIEKVTAYITFCLHCGWIELFVGEETSWASKHMTVWGWREKKTQWTDDYVDIQRHSWSIVLKLLNEHLK